MLAFIGWRDPEHKGKIDNRLPTQEKGKNASTFYPAPICKTSSIVTRGNGEPRIAISCCFKASLSGTRNLLQCREVCSVR